MSYTATYCRRGLGSSPAAYAAEDDGRLPLSRAIPAIAKIANVARKEAREALLATFDGEWHHTSKNANRTAFYELAAAINYLASQPLAAKLNSIVPSWREQITEAIRIINSESSSIRCKVRDSAIDIIATACNIDSHAVLNMYYGNYDVNDYDFSAASESKEVNHVA